MTSAEKFEMWLSIHKMEDHAPELVPGLEAMMELMDFQPVPQWVLEIKEGELKPCDSRQGVHDGEVQ